MFGFTQLGTGVHRPTPDRQLTSAVVQINGDNYLFDAPEGIQTSLQQHGAGMKLEAICLTGLTKASLLGLPGLLTTLDSLDDTHEGEPLSDVTIYAPAGSGTRARIQKFTDLAETPAVQIEPVPEGATLVETDEYVLETVPTKRSTGGDSVGYRVREPERPGEFNREKAEELGVPVGPKFGKLHEGEAVELEDGRVIHPDQVVGDPRPGRSLAYTGATEHFAGLADHLRGTDVLLCDGGVTSDDFAQQPVDNHMSAYQAGALAEAADVSVLIPTHLRGTYGPNAAVLKPDLKQSFDGQFILPHDGMRYSLVTRDSPGRASHWSDVLSENPA